MLPKQTSHYFFADVLKALAIIAVIVLHIASDYVDQYGEISNSAWWSANIYNGLVRFCVPMFVMLSGALLLKPGKTVNATQIFYKRLPRILIPLIFWSIVYIIFDSYTAGKSIAQIDLKTQLKIFYLGPVVFHLWYLYMLIGIYLLYPIINVFISAASEIQVRYLLIICLVANCIFGIINIIFKLDTGIDLNFFTGYILYFVLGYYLFHFTFTSQQLGTAYALGIVGFLISIFTSYICVLLNFSNCSALIESDFTPDIVLSVSGLFLFMKHRFNKNDKSSIINKCVLEISKASFGIYLVHVLVMRYIFSETRTYYESLQKLHLALLIPLEAFVILILSFIIIKLIRYVPYLRKIAG